MYRFLLALSLLIATPGSSQDSLGPNQKDSHPVVMDYSSRLDSERKAEINQMTERSVNAYAEYAREQRAKQKKKAIIYLSIGILGLVVLVVGLRRNARKKV